MHEVRENPTTDRGSSPDWDYAEFVLGVPFSASAERSSWETGVDGAPVPSGSG